MDCFIKAIEKDPTSNVAYYFIGLEYYFSEKYTEAAESFQKSIELDPEYPFAYNGLADVCYHVGLTDDAIENYKKSIELDSDIESYVLETFNYFKMKKSLENKFLKDNAPNFKLKLEKLN